MRNVAPPSKLVELRGVSHGADETTVVTYASRTTQDAAYMVRTKGVPGWKAVGVTNAGSTTLGTGLKKAHAVRACSDYCASKASKA